MDKEPKIFLITTHHNRDTRHERIKRELLGLDYTPILAPDWKMFRHTSLNQKQYKHMSLTLAYYQICQTAVFQELDKFIIIEDDLHVVDESLLQELISNPPGDFDLCYLTRTDHNRESAVTKPYNTNFERVASNWWETPITMWTARFAQKFIKHIEAKLEEGLWLGHIDHELVKLCETSVFYGSIHQTAIGLSNIDQSLMDYAGSISMEVNG